MDIDANGQGFELHNKGHIAGDVSGLYLAFGATVDNRNVLTGGDFGIFDSNGTLHLTNSGELNGTKNAIFSNFADDSTIDNVAGGKITGETAILFQRSKDVLITYGDDSLLIRHMDVQDLDSGDFFYF